MKFATTWRHGKQRVRPLGKENEDQRLCTGMSLHEVEVLARVLLPEIQAFFESEERQREFAEWKVKTEIYFTNKESFSEVEVIVITAPPKIASSWLPTYVTNRSFGNERIGEFVTALIAMCNENGVPYVDVYGALKNEAGALPDDFCRDGYIHLNNAGAKVVVDALYAFAASQN